MAAKAVNSCLLLLH